MKAIWAGGLLALSWLGGSAAKWCQEESVLELQFVNNTGPNGETQLCADGSVSGFYIDKQGASANANYLIWLGDSPLVGSEEDYEATCLENGCTTEDNSTACLELSSHCSSSRWNEIEMQAETIMCRGNDNPFKDYVKVYIPACSLDWFLGRGGESTKYPQLFNGAHILDAVVESLLLSHGLDTAEKVILGGFRGGGVGALSSARRVSDMINNLSLQPVSVSVLMEGSFLVSTRGFGVTDYDRALEEVLPVESMLINGSKDWIKTAAIEPACKTLRAEEDLYSCLIAENLLALPELANLRVFVLQSQYDFEQLTILDVRNEKKQDSFVDEGAYSQAVMSFVKTYSAAQREAIQFVQEQSVTLSALQSTKQFFAPGCTQEQYFPVSSFFTAEDSEIKFGRAGSIVLKSDGTGWDQVKVNGVTVRQALNDFFILEKGANSALLDGCSDFLCNDSCPSKLKSFELDNLTDDCTDSTVVAYCLAFIALFFLLFMLTLIRVSLFRNTCRSYWKNHGRMNAESTDIFRDAAAGIKGRSIQLMVENLNYWAPSKKRGEQPYQILKNVSLSFNAGSVSALMGPSGSGKSTLLDVLSYTRESGRITGTHYINGVPSHLSRAAFLREWLRNSVSYVRQQDVLFPALTVREHLEHAAWLMLPQFMPAKKKLHRVWQVIKLLELEGCADTICGDGGVRIEGGISGGQRRRVSVATQLLKMPTALLLDEPTSGLDSTNALVLVECLKNLAEKAGVTVIMTIHQPRSEIFRLLDSLSILVKGRVVFSGSPMEAANTFGVDINEANVGDEILDMLQTATPEKVDEYRRAYQQGHLGRAVVQTIEESKTELTPQNATALRSILVENAIAEGRWSWTEATSMITTMWVLMSRVLRRGGFDIYRTVPFSLVGGVLVGLVFLKEPTYTSQTALAYLGVSTMTFLQSTFLGDRYNAEKQMWSHERDNGTNINWLSFLICLFIRNIVSSTLEGLAFAVPIFFMGQMTDDTFSIVLNYLILMTLTSIAVIVQNTTVEIDRIRRGGETGPDTRQAVLINMSLLALSALFNGFIIQLKDIPSYLQWIPYVMLTFWSFVGILVNNFEGQTFPQDNISPLEAVQRTGDNWIRTFDYDKFNQYQAMFALLVLIVGLHVVSIVDFYFRFAYNTSRLKRGKPKNATEEDGGGILAGRGGSPRIGRSPSAGSLGNQDSEHASELATGSRGKFLSALLNRETLAAYFLLDALFAWTVCLFRDSSVDAAMEEVSSDSVLNATAGLFSGDSFSIDSVSVGFIIYNLAVFSVYVLQFLIQILFLVPIRGDGSRKSIVWISFFDLLALISLAADAGLLLAFFLLGYGDVQRNLLLITAIHLVRYFFVSCYWFKVNSFHRSRAKQFKKLARGEVMSVASSPAGSFGAGESHAKGRVDPMDSLGSSFNNPPPLPPSRMNRISGMFSKAPPPLPPSRVSTQSQRFRALDLGPQWRAFQQHDQEDDMDV